MHALLCSLPHPNKNINGINNQSGNLDLFRRLRAKQRGNYACYFLYPIHLVHCALRLHKKINNNKNSENLISTAGAKSFFFFLRSVRVYVCCGKQLFLYVGLF